jgi:hypothetical protein
MTKTNMDLSELLAKHDQGDFLCGIAEAVLQLIMETDVEGIIGAGRHERSGERTTWHNHCPAGECMHSPRGGIGSARSIPVWAP